MNKFFFNKKKTTESKNLYANEFKVTYNPSTDQINMISCDMPISATSFTFIRGNTYLFDISEFRKDRPDDYIFTIHGVTENNTNDETNTNHKYFQDIDDIKLVNNKLEWKIPQHFIFTKVVFRSKKNDLKKNDIYLKVSQCDELQKKYNELQKKYRKISFDLRMEKGGRKRVESKLKALEKKYEKLEKKYEDLEKKYEKLEKHHKDHNNDHTDSDHVHKDPKLSRTFVLDTENGLINITGDVTNLKKGEEYYFTVKQLMRPIDKTIKISFFRDNLYFSTNESGNGRIRVDMSDDSLIFKLVVDEYYPFDKIYLFCTHSSFKFKLNKKNSIALKVK